MKSVFLLIFLVVSFFGHSQIINLGQDTSLCPGNQLQLVGIPLDSSLIFPFVDPDTVIMNEDQYSGIINLGFNFTFYDSIYSQVVVGQNGILSFDLSKANGNCPWYLANAIPSASIHTNNIMLPYVDIYDYSTQFVYETIGIQPNRIFVLQAKCGSLYGNCGPGEETISFGAILRESTNEVEIYIGNKSTCAWNGSHAIEGLHHRSGTIAHAVPGRNYPTTWVASVDGKKWSPNGVSDYIISDIPYKIAMDSFEYVWVNTLGDVFPYTDTLLITGQALTESVGYFLGLRSLVSQDWCPPIQSLYSDTTWINQDSQPNSLAVVHGFCGAPVGQIYSTYLNSTNNSFYWFDIPLYSDTLTGLSPGVYNYIYTGNNGCSTTDSVVLVNENGFNVDVDSTLCPYDVDGAAAILPAQPYFSYVWVDFPFNTTNTINAVGTGTYTCFVSSSIGCGDTVDVFIPSGAGVSVYNQFISHESCFDASDGAFQFDVSTNDPPFNITWNGSAISSQQLSGISPGSYILSIMDNVGCVYDSIYAIDGVSIELAHSAPTITPEMFGSDGEAQINSFGGTPPYQYNIGNGYQSSNVFSALTAGSYTVIVQDVNGCLDTVSITIESELGLEESIFNSLNVYPNPVDDELTIEMSDYIFNITISDLLGRILIYSSNNSDKITVPMDDFTKGLYNLYIAADGRIIHRIFMVN